MMLIESPFLTGRCVWGPRKSYPCCVPRAATEVRARPRSLTAPGNSTNKRPKRPNKRVFYLFSKYLETSPREEGELEENSGSGAEGTKGIHVNCTEQHRMAGLIQYQVLLTRPVSTKRIATCIALLPTKCAFRRNFNIFWRCCASYFDTGRHGVGPSASRTYVGRPFQCYHPISKARTYNYF